MLLFQNREKATHKFESATALQSLSNMNSGIQNNYYGCGVDNIDQTTLSINKTLHFLLMKLTPWHLSTAIKVKGDKRRVLREHRSFDFNHRSPNSTNGSYCCVMKETLLLIILLFSSSTY